MLKGQKNFMVNPDIFRQYDIRGVWGKDVSPGEAWGQTNLFQICLIIVDNIRNCMYYL